MELTVEVISKETIKPSSPSNLQHYQLSFLDQLAPPVYNPWILFYPPSRTDLEFDLTKTLNHLKQSLSEALTIFYPLCGTLNNNSSIHCNDAGVLFQQASVGCKLFDVIENPIPVELNKLVPFELEQNQQEYLVGVQFNVFSCNGIAIGLCVSHKVVDASSFFTFLKAWAAIARKEAEIIHPEFVSSTLFPPKDLSGFYNPSTGLTKNNVAVKRLVFTPSSIEQLKAKFAKGESLKDQRPPTRVEALSVFIWRRFMAAVGHEKIHSMLYAVNLRSRMDPPLPEHSFGNYSSFAITFPTNIGGEEDCSALISQVRESISKLNNEFVEKLRRGNEFLEMMKQKSESYHRGEFVSLNFTSLCRFPLYEADFGWAKPIWVGAPALTFKNLIVFMDTATGNGIEALVHLEKDDMVRFEKDHELFQYTTD